MNKRLLPLLLLVGFLLGACSSGFDDPSNPQLGEIESGGQALPALLTGLTETQLTSYLDWFRGTDPTAPAIIEPQLATADNRGDAHTVQFVDPACAMEYDYARMADGWGDNRKAEIRLADANTAGSGFYNPARQEALLLMQGYAFSASGRNAICRTPLWVPIRVNLSSGVWTVEGYTTPATNVQISVTGSHALVPVVSDVEFAGDVNDFVSPPRLARFKVTDENFSRVMRYATVSNRGGASRHIAWFRQSDVSPNYGHLSEGTKCTPAYFAFWGWAGSHTGNNLAPCQAAWGGHTEGDPTTAGDDFDSDSEMWLDELARMNSGGDNVWESNADDRCDITRDGACRLQEDEGWKQVAQLLTCLSVKDFSAADGNCGGSRAAALDKLKALLTKYGALAENDIPDIFGGWDHTDGDVFGVIVANGNEAWTQTRNNMKDKSALNGLTGFVGKSECNFSPCGRENSITVTASFQYDQVNTDEGAAAFYNAHSLLSGKKMMNVMSFSTADSSAVDGAGAGGLLYEQAPLAKIEIVVSDPLNQGNQSRYSSHWLPLYSIGRNGSELTYSKAFDLLGDPGGSLQRAFSDLVYNIYRSTLGSWVAGVSQAATSTMLAVPNLEPYQVAYYNQFNEPIYTLNRELIRPDLVRRTSGAGSGPELIDLRLDYSRLSGDALTCTQAAMSGTLAEPTAATDVCFAKNGLFSVWFWIRGLVMVILLWHVFAYGYGLITRKHEGGNAGFITPANFMARMAIVLFLIFGMETILFVLQTIVGETIVITNLIGTQVAGGTPYNHLWLFGSFLNSPTREVSIFGLIILAPFTLIGLIALLMAAWLRIGITFALIILSPWWAMSLLSSPEPGRFYASLKLLLRLYLIPLLVLVLLLIMFVGMRWLGADLSQDGGLLAAVISMGLLIALAVSPFFLSKWAFGSMLGKIEATMKSVTSKQKEAAKASTALDGATGQPQQLPGGVGRPGMQPQAAGPAALGGMRPPPGLPGGMPGAPGGPGAPGAPTGMPPGKGGRPDPVAALGGGEVTRQPVADVDSRTSAPAGPVAPRWARKGRLARMGDALGAAGKKAAGTTASGIGAGIKGTALSGALGSEFSTMSGATGSKAVLESAWMLASGREALPDWVTKKVDFKKVDDKIKTGFKGSVEKVAGYDKQYRDARARRAALEGEAREADADVVSAQRQLEAAQTSGDAGMITEAERNLTMAEQRAVNAYSAAASVSRISSIVDVATDPLAALRRPMTRRGEATKAESAHFQASRRMADLAADKAAIDAAWQQVEARAESNPKVQELRARVAELEGTLAEMPADDPERMRYETMLNSAREYELRDALEQAAPEFGQLQMRRERIMDEMRHAGVAVERSQDSIDAISNRRAWRERAERRASADNSARYEAYQNEVAARTSYWNQQAASLSEQLNNPGLDASTRRSLEAERDSAMREAQQLSRHQAEVGRNASAGRWFKAVYSD